MNNYNRMRYKYLLYILTIVFFATACGEKKEGCLDIIAANFDASADNDCCCTYPNLVMNVTHKFDEDLTFRLDSAYTYNGIDSFVVKDMSLLFSKVHPIKDDVIYLTEDTIHINIDDNQGAERLEIEDNFVLVKPNRFRYEIGTFSKPDTYDEIELTFGLGGDLERIVPDSVYATEHILQSEEDSIWTSDEGYFYLYIKVLPISTEPNNEREIVLSGANHLLEWNMEQQLLADIGYDFELNIKIDYKTLFDGIDFVADDDETVGLKVKQSLISSISFDDP